MEEQIAARILKPKGRRAAKISRERKEMVAESSSRNRDCTSSATSDSKNRRATVEEVNDNFCLRGSRRNNKNKSELVNTGRTMVLLSNDVNAILHYAKEQRDH